MFYCLFLQGTPQVIETFIDSKKEVDNQLKKTCEDFIHNISDEFIGPLRNFIDKVRIWFIIFYYIVHLVAFYNCQHFSQVYKPYTRG